jgi:adenylate cyclase
LPKTFNYTSRAKRFALKYPLLSDIGIQIFYWVFAFLLYFILVNHISKGVASLFDLNAEVHMTENVIIAVIGAAVYGTILGLIDFYIERRFVRRSLGLELIAKFSLYAVSWFLIMGTTRIIGLAVEAKFIDNASVEYTNVFFSNFGAASTIYAIVMIAGISFIKQMNNKFGPGIILPMLMGRYRKPREEERIFMFMDLKSSTTYAEKLGHLKYSEMIQRCFLDLNKVIPSYYAEVYQYVGDEVVLTWPVDEGVMNLNCLDFFFAFKQQLNNQENKYKTDFGLLPEFKAGLHAGKITVAEVGDIKREIAYHGDTINTASRIQKLCNKYDQKFIASETVKSLFDADEAYKFVFLDETALQGKTENIKLYSISKIDSLYRG